MRSLPILFACLLLAVPYPAVAASFDEAALVPARDDTAARTLADVPATTAIRFATDRTAKPDRFAAVPRVYDADRDDSATMFTNAIEASPPAPIAAPVAHVAPPARASSRLPETATWATMILGFGAIGYAMRRIVGASEARFNARIRRIAEGDEG